MNSNKFTILLIFIFNLSLFNSTIAQTRKAKATIVKTKSVKNTKLTSSAKFNRNTQVIISLGVINAHTAKPEDLVKPTYPPAARAMGLAGTVNVEVLIKEDGSVIKASAISGHPLLRGFSIAAARQSKFTITTLSGFPVQVRGIIVYNFVPSSFNWLEIGYVLQNKGSNSIDGIKYSFENLINLLPYEFESERQMLQILDKNWGNEDSILPTVRSMVKGKLSNRPKELWLFSLGSFLSETETNIRSGEIQQNLLQDLRLLLQTAPENIKPSLILRLQKLYGFLENPLLDEYNPETGSKSRQMLNRVLEQMPFLGR